MSHLKTEESVSCQSHFKLQFVKILITSFDNEITLYKAIYSRMTMTHDGRSLFWVGVNHILTYYFTLLISEFKHDSA